MSDVDDKVSDCIEKKLFLRASRARVWRALSDSQEFGVWFELKLEGPFVVGKKVRGRILTKGYEHLTTEMTVERMEPERLFSYRWHPYAIEPEVDYSVEPTTLVEFHLQEAAGGTELRLVESGFDQIPAARRATAFRMNDGGWTEQMKNLERHVGRTQ